MKYNTLKMNQSQGNRPVKAGKVTASVRSQKQRVPSRRTRKPTSDTASKPKQAVKSKRKPSFPRVFANAAGVRRLSPEPAFVDASMPHEEAIPLQKDISLSIHQALKRDKIGKLLRFAIDKFEHQKPDDTVFPVATYVEAMTGLDAITQSSMLPVVLKLPTQTPRVKESWRDYKSRMEDYLEPVRKLVAETMGMNAVNLIAANAIKFKGTLEQIKLLSGNKRIARIELDPMLNVTAMDNVCRKLQREQFLRNNSGLDGSGVRVAILDSGIDLRHPYLRVADSVSTCTEGDDIPGAHGTHCAGVIASTDHLYRGIAPGVELLNVKVLHANGRGSHTNIVKGIDEALEMGADILSMSLAFNHFPEWAHNGHNWQCSSGHCPMCVAVDNVVKLDNAIVVVAAGNDHITAESLRRNDFGDCFDTELSCPGQSREAITVGALGKDTFSLAEFSSRGLTSYGISKPDLCAPGTDVMSTVPVLRDIYGQPIRNPKRKDLFTKKSGTSIATPIVAGVVALIVQKLRGKGIFVGARAVKEVLYSRGVSILDGSIEIGLGKVLSRI